MTSSMKQPFYYAAGLILMKGVSFLMLPFVARALSTEEFGQLDLWLSLLNIGGIIMGFGLIESLYKFWGQTDKKHRKILFTNAMHLQIIVAFATALACFPFALLLIQVFPEIEKIDLALCLLTLIANACINIPLSWLRLTESAAQFFLLTSIKALVQAAMTLYFISEGLGVTGILLSGFLSSVGLSIALLQIHRGEWQWHPQPILQKALRHYGFPLVVSSLLLFCAAGVERFILAATIGLSALAQYALAMQFAMVIALLCEPLTLWWFPKRFAILNGQHGKLRAAAYSEAICHLSLWFMIGFIMVAPWVIQQWFPERYHTAITLLPWLCLGIAFKQMSHVLNIGCYTQARPTSVLRLNFYFALLAIVLFSTGSWLFGLSGVVGAFVFIYALRAISFFYVSQSITRLPHHTKELLCHALVLTFVLLMVSFSSSLRNQTLCLLSVLIFQTVWIVAWVKQHILNQKPLTFIWKKGTAA